MSSQQYTLLLQQESSTERETGSRSFVRIYHLVLNRAITVLTIILLMSLSLNAMLIYLHFQAQVEHSREIPTQYGMRFRASFSIRWECAKVIRQLVF